MMLKRLKYALKQYPVFTFVPISNPYLVHREHARLAFLRPPPRPFLRPPPPLPFVLPPRKNYNRSFPQMLRPPPTPPPRNLVVPRPPKNLYMEINKQMIHRPPNLMIEITLAICKNRLAHITGLTPKVRDILLKTPCIRVHGLRLCFLDQNNNFCYLNHQNQKFLDRASWIEECEAAREYILNDLINNGYEEACIHELATIWYDDSRREPIDFWIYQFLKHGYCALDDPTI